MNIVILIVVIVVLILVHEFGHFIAAKLTGMRVDEFGLGYPPRAMTLAKKGGTAYTLNWIPFGGFVKIYGENSEQEAGAVSRDPRAFTAKNRFAQAFVLVAGVTMNVLFAYVLITGALITGTPRALESNEIAGAKNVQLAVSRVLPDSPAALAGMQPGDSIITAVTTQDGWQATDPESFTNFVSKSEGFPIRLTLKRGGADVSVTAKPIKGIITSDVTRYALGVEVATIGTVPLSLGEAVTQGASLTWGVTKLTAIGLAQFFYSIFTFSANLSQVSGPVGIAGVVGSASAQGFGDLLSIMAVISINLALINLIPVPALDGGRLLFVIIEGIIRRPIKPSIAQAVNGIGFAFLILLMIVVTAHDIFKLVG